MTSRGCAKGLSGGIEPLVTERAAGPTGPDTFLGVQRAEAEGGVHLQSRLGACSPSLSDLISCGWVLTGLVFAGEQSGLLSCSGGGLNLTSLSVRFLTGTTRRAFGRRCGSTACAFGGAS